MSKWGALLLCATTVTADLAWYDPSGVLHFDAGGDEADVGAWLERRGLPVAKDGLPVADIFNPPTSVRVFVVDGDATTERATYVQRTAVRLPPHVTFATPETAEARALDFVSSQHQGEASVALVVSGRRLQDDAGDDGTTDDGTTDDGTTDAGSSKFRDITDINQYQLNMWTAIALIVVLASAIFALATMRPEYDSLLYATFQANVATPVAKLE